MPIFISFLEIVPLCTERIGPTRFLLSVPFMLSPKSLARLDNIWSNIIVSKHQKAMFIENSPVCNAMKEPRSTPDTDNGRVRSLSAFIHAFILDVFLFINTFLFDYVRTILVLGLQNYKKNRNMFFIVEKSEIFVEGGVFYSEFILLSWQKKQWK